MSRLKEKQMNPENPVAEKPLALIPYSRQAVDEEDIQAVCQVLRSDWLTTGPMIRVFEEAIAQAVDARYAVVFNSGTAALHGAYFVSGLGAGDQFITSPNTFVATSNAGLYLNAIPVFVDIDPHTGNINAGQIEAKITARTRMIVPVHYAGCPADMLKIYHLAQKHGLVVVEDACHALGSTYMGKRTGECAFSDMVVFSFHPVKHITTGEGGAVVTNNKEYYTRLQQFKSHGIVRDGFGGESPGDWYYEMNFLGFNYRMSDIQAALGLSQLSKLDDFVSKRRQIAASYHRAFRGNPYFVTPVDAADSKSSYHLYPIRLKSRFLSRKKSIFRALRRRGLGVQVHYLPVYRHPYYRGLGFADTFTPNAEDFYAREISIPLFPSMTSRQVETSADTLLDVFRQESIE